MLTLSTKAHGMMDYPSGATLLSAPLLMGMKGAALTTAMIVGGTEIVQSLLTDYELGVVRKIPMKMHLITDVISGLMLATSPFLFGFRRKKNWIGHVLMGLFMSATALMTRSTPEDTIEDSEPMTTFRSSTRSSSRPQPAYH